MSVMANAAGSSSSEFVGGFGTLLQVVVDNLVRTADEMRTLVLGHMTSTERLTLIRDGVVPVRLQTVSVLQDGLEQLLDAWDRNTEDIVCRLLGDDTPPQEAESHREQLLDRIAATFGGKMFFVQPLLSEVFLQGLALKCQQLERDQHSASDADSAQGASPSPTAAAIKPVAERRTLILWDIENCFDMSLTAFECAEYLRKQATAVLGIPVKRSCLRTVCSLKHFDIIFEQGLVQENTEVAFEGLVRAGVEVMVCRRKKEAADHAMMNLLFGNPEFNVVLVSNDLDFVAYLKTAAQVFDGDGSGPSPRFSWLFCEGKVARAVTESLHAYGVATAFFSWPTCAPPSSLGGHLQQRSQPDASTTLTTNRYQLLLPRGGVTGGYGFLIAHFDVAQNQWVPCLPSSTPSPSQSQKDKGVFLPFRNHMDAACVRQLHVGVNEVRAADTIAVRFATGIKGTYCADGWFHIA